MSTIFSKIIDGEIPCNKIYEDDKTLCFYDIAPRAKVHALVIPKNPSTDLNTASLEDISACMATVKKVVSILGIDKSGYRLITNIGKDGRQEVEHLHFHILGGELLGSSINSAKS